MPVLRRRFVDLPIAGTLTVLTTITSAVSMTAVCVILGWYNASAMRARLVEDTSRLLNGVGANSAITLLFKDERVAQDIARAVSLDPQVRTAAFLLADGRVLARHDRRSATGIAPALHVDPAAIKAGQEWHAFTDDSLVMVRPLQFEGELVGAAYLALDLSVLHAGTTRLWRMVCFAWIVSSVAAALLGWRLQRIVSRPILALAEVTRQVTDRQDLGLRATKVGNNEIGALVDHFNAMLTYIQYHEGRLEEYRRDLERQVELRTAELNARQERYRLLLESTHAVPWEIDAVTFTMTYVAPQITALAGFDPDAIVGHSAWELIHPQDRERLRLEVEDLIAHPDRGTDVEFRHLTTWKDPLHVRCVVRSHQEQGGAVVLRGITVDVTQQKRLELELRQSQKLESVGRLAAGVAHEINTPIQFVNDSVHFVHDAMIDLSALIRACQAYGDLAALGAVTPEATSALHEAAEHADIEYVLDNVPKALERSLEGLERVAVIVRSMKEFAHPDQKEMALVDLNQAIRSTLTIARHEYKYVADIVTDFGELPPVTCHGGDINQVVLNLVVNAAHAITDRNAGSERRGRITVQTRAEGDTVSITIGDTGSGIPVDVREHIFDPFFTTKEVGRGTGQGLAIARSVVLEKHGGTLTFETEIGVGTVFTIRLPVAGRRMAA